MWPFECVDNNGKTYFHYDNWGRFLAQKQKGYPPPIDHRRYAITLIYPRLRLEEVFIPTGSLSHHDISFHSNNWSTIFDVYPAHCFTADGDNSIILLIEEGHVNPWGTPVVVMSDNPEHGFDNSYRNFVYFRGRYWKILNAVDLTNALHYRIIGKDTVT